MHYWYWKLIRDKRIMTVLSAVCFVLFVVLVLCHWPVIIQALFLAVGAGAAYLAVEGKKGYTVTDVKEMLREVRREVPKLKDSVNAIIRQLGEFENKKKTIRAIDKVGVDYEPIKEVEKTVEGILVKRSLQAYRRLLIVSSKDKPDEEDVVYVEKIVARNRELLDQADEILVQMTDLDKQDESDDTGYLDAMLEALKEMNRQEMGT